MKKTYYIQVHHHPGAWRMLHISGRPNSAYACAFAIHGTRLTYLQAIFYFVCLRLNQHWRNKEIRIFKRAIQ